MDETSTGAIVPSVKGEASKTLISIPSRESDVTLSADPFVSRMDKELLCPICMQIIKDAFLTACGHSFCYMCIITHLNNKNDCPNCGSRLTNEQLFPNFLLDKLLKKASSRQVSKRASPVEQFRQALQQGSEVSVKELDNLLILLLEKRRKMEQEEAERNTQTLTDFLQCLRRKKVAELKEMQTDLQYISGDVNSVERHRIELYMARDRYTVPRMVADNPAITKSWSTSIDRNAGIPTSSSRAAQTGRRMGNFQYMKADGKVQVSSLSQEGKNIHGGLESQHPNQTNLSAMKKKRVHAQFNNLQDCYLQKRRELANDPSRQEDKSNVSREGYNAGLADFQSVLKTFTQYSRMKVIAELKHGDLFYHTANIISSIEFNLDNELFATAGVSRCIKVFDYSLVVNEPADGHSPVVEMSTRSKLSCLSWNKFTKNLIASSDYDGVVTVWDVNRSQSVVDYEEHEKRIWSVDFSSTEPSMLVSGSDDCKVKIWCSNQEASALTIDMQANICSVKYNPASSFHVAVGSADHLVHYYDLRKPKQPLHTFSGHNKTVSYVKFLSKDELASASTDNTLRLWDVKALTPIRTYEGHTNEKNFVGLSVKDDGFLACGSETNDAFVYHKAISRPVTWHKFGLPDAEDGSDEETGAYFISSVCWKNDSSTLLAANSQGTIKVLALAP